MPELAEVETVARGLRAIAGCRITGVRFGKTDFIHQPARLEALLPGSLIAEIRRHGKLLLIGCDRPPGETLALRSPGKPAPVVAKSWQAPGCTGTSSTCRYGDGAAGPARLWLMVHLGMTGQLLLDDPAGPVAPHTHAWFALDDGRELRYVDIRRFGRLRVATPAELASLLAPLGAEPLELPRAEFRRRLGSRRAGLKALLLDQHVLRGLGNIYADESLWRARLHPLRLGSDLSVAELDRLWRSIRRVASEAIRRRGTSIANYVDTQGRPGTFQRFLRVYQRTGRPCPRCHAAIERAIIAGRSSHFCPRCQRRGLAPSRARKPAGSKGVQPAHPSGGRRRKGGAPKRHSGF